MAKARLPLLLGILVVLLGGFGYAMAQVTVRPEAGAFAALAVLALVAGLTGAYGLSLVLAVAFHELGHFVAGRAVGFRFHTLVAGPLGFRMEGGKVVRYRVRPARLHGFVVMVPDHDEDLRRRYRLFILGGPVASLLWCALLYAAWRGTGLPFLFAPRQASLGVAFGGIVSGLVLLGSVLMLSGTLLPYRVRRMGGLPTDMLQLLLLRREGEASQRLLAALTLTRLIMTGTPIRELPAALVEEASGIQDGGVQELSVLFIRWAYGVHHDPQAARAAILRHAEVVEALGPSLIDPWRTSARLVQALDAVFHRKDSEAGMRWLHDVGEPTQPSLAASVALAHAGIAALRDAPDREERLAKAERAVDEAARVTTVDLTDERTEIAALRRGWPLNPTHPFEDHEDAACEESHQTQ